MKTKIIVTLGPKTEDKEVLDNLIEAGTTMVRFNFSHASNEQFVKYAKIIRQLARKHKHEVAIMQDLQGPRIRVGKLPSEGVMLKDGMRVGFTTGLTDIESNLINIDYKDLHVDINKSDLLFLSNGAIELIVESVKDEVIWCKVTNGGVLFSHKGVNVPNTHLKGASLTEKDLRDLKFGLSTGLVDYIALSFVQTADDVIRLQKLIDKHDQRKVKAKIISKIERGTALADIDRIIVESDVIMFARGDLGIEVPMENLPIIQKNIVRHAHWHNTPVIIATQVLTSMIVNQNPTRAEVSDIANAIFDRADAIMLSDETAVGAYPVEAVRLLKRVIRRTEQYIDQKNFFDTSLQKVMSRKYENGYMHE
jgi:pyruvate kinase